MSVMYAQQLISRTRRFFTWNSSLSVGLIGADASVHTKLLTV
jgi:hypothetical protein